MRSLSYLLCAGAAVAGLSFLAPAVAQALDTHRLTVALPGGGVETIQYTGKIAPRVAFATPDGALADPFATAAWPVAGLAMPSFAALDRISAEMDWQMKAMMRQAEALSRASQGQGLETAVLHGLPPGTSLSIVSQSFGNGVCTRVTRLTQGPQDAKPKLVSQSSGDCARDPGLLTQPLMPGQAGSDLKQVRYLPGAQSNSAF